MDIDQDGDKGSELVIDNQPLAHGDTDLPLGTLLWSRPGLKPKVRWEDLKWVNSLIFNPEAFDSPLHAEIILLDNRLLIT
jgi:hypothetical protein